MSRAAGAAGTRRWWSRPWIQVSLLLAVLTGALIVGSGIGSGTESPAQRAAALEARVRCPSCTDISVAQSTASAAVAVRHEISQMVAEGRSDQQIDTALVAQYGPSILLEPPASGLNLVVWLVPVLAGTAALGALATLFWRRTRALRAERTLQGEGP